MTVMRAEEMNGPYVDQPGREPQVVAEMQHLGEVVEALVKQSEELAQRLKPLTGDLMADADKLKEPGELVPLAREIASIRRKAENASDNISLIYKNLEI